MSKYKYGTYHTGSFRGGRNIDLNLITCKDKNIIPSKLQSCALHCCHTYPLRPGMDRTEVMICQHLYWPKIRYAVQKEVTNCDTCHHTKYQMKNMVNYQLSYLRKFHGINSVYI